MRTLLIVWFSRTGGTEHMVKAFETGAARAAGDAVQVRTLRAEEAGPDDLLQCNAVLFAAPENLASLAGEMKAFFDRCYYPMLGKLQGKSYACAICAGSDGQGAARQVARIAQGWRMKAIAEPLIINTRAQSAEAILAPKELDDAQRRACQELAGTLAAGLELGLYD